MRNRIIAAMAIASAYCLSDAQASYCDALYNQLAVIQTQEGALDREFRLTKDALRSSGVDIDNIDNDLEFKLQAVQKPSVWAKCLLLGSDYKGTLWCDVYWFGKLPLVQKRKSVESVLRQNNCR